MSQPKLYFPVKPLHVNQAFGGNAADYAKFGLKGHNGIDFMAYHGQPVYAAHDGLATYSTDAHGGEGVTILSQDGYRSVYWHLCDPVKEINFISPVWQFLQKNNRPMPMKAGDLIGYADNTGAPYESSGDHLHFGIHPCNVTHSADLYPANGYDGCIDPMPYFNGLFAQDIPSLTKLYQALLTALQHMIPLLRPKTGA